HVGRPRAGVRVPGAVLVLVLGGDLVQPAAGDRLAAARLDGLGEAPGDVLGHAAGLHRVGAALPDGGVAVGGVELVGVGVDLERVDPRVMDGGGADHVDVVILGDVLPP